MGASRALLSHHLHRRPAGNPIAAFRAALPEHLEALAARPMDYFHLYAFNTLRQVGANFELLGMYARWIGGPTDAVEACAALSATAKAFQFQLARGRTGGDSAITRNRWRLWSAPTTGRSARCPVVSGDRPWRASMP
nr:DUF1839 family protein [Azospirillum brasilense]